ncbi:MAG: hypothetical protein WCO96_07125 [Actinomycetes bacterium]
MPAQLMAVPNISCGRDPAVIEAVGRAYRDAGALLLDTHTDVDHDRSVHTLAAPQGVLAGAVAAGARLAAELIDISANTGVHPHVGALDIAPVVHLDDARRGAAVAEALVLGGLIGDAVGIPVLLYGEMASGRKRSEIRSGGLEELSRLIGSGELQVDFGPGRIDPRTGVTMVGSRGPMVAFNLVMDGSVTLERAREVAAAVREGGANGLPGVRALGLELDQQGLVQVSANLERPWQAGIAELHSAVSALAPVSHGELVGLAPRSVLERALAVVAIPGADPDLHSIEGCLRFHGVTG